MPDTPQPNGQHSTMWLFYAHIAMLLFGLFDICVMSLAVDLVFLVIGGLQCFVLLLIGLKIYKLLKKEGAL